MTNNNKSKKQTKKKKSEELEQLRQEFDTCKAELESSKDKYIRLFAEFENYKKRSARERMELINTAAQDTIKALLPVLDDFNRAKRSADDASTEEHFSDGVRLVYNKLLNTVEQLGLKEMDMGDMQFDESYHDAITHVPVDDKSKDGMIIDVIEPGYLLHDKIIRYAKVVVGKYNS